ncbi:BrnT family toxin [Aureimonas mangrovi]|uniref:BrnT family toxin n=1 Tax=Aureimonas mangrovi TaxID=2758041 RepID=UPI00163DDDD9|nr:BrnT family toxin [Aureimonas mangrovi]
MEFEWDEAKRWWNLETRGLDFADVAYFDMNTVLTFEDRRRDYGEPRYNSIDLLFGRLCTFYWTPRGKRVRIISMRKANDRERAQYERQTSDLR